VTEYLEAISLLWSLLVVPIGWIIKVIFVWVRGINRKVNTLTSNSNNYLSEKDIMAIMETRFKPMWDEIVVMRNDFKVINGSISETARAMDTRINSLMLKLLENRGRHD
jgi:hypothetical protein